MSKQETNKMRAEQKGQIHLEDLPVDEARQDEVKGGESVEPDTKYRLIILAARR
jgi:hypothetical protein